MSDSTASPIPNLEAKVTQVERPRRMVSIDLLRGFVMFTMIFVNDLAGASDSIVPGWMKHFRGRDGMTFVDLVFPAFLFVVGMSIPLAVNARLQAAQPRWRVTAHVFWRVFSLLVIGILMVNETPDSSRMGWSGTLWSTLMYASAMLAFCSVEHRPDPREPSPAPRKKAIAFAPLIRAGGWISLLALALTFRGNDGHRILSFAPFRIHTEWYGILGLIGWAYLVGSLVFLAFRQRTTALLGCVVLLTCLYPAERGGAFAHFWLAHYVGIGGTLGSQAAITVAGVLLTSLLTTRQNSDLTKSAGTALLFSSGFAAAALLLRPLYGIHKNSATPSWCLWACAISASLWLVFYLLSNAEQPGRVTRILAASGQNVLLAYLISEMLPSLIELIGLGGWYDRLATPHLAQAILRSVGCALAVLAVTAGLNRLGIRLRI